MHITVIKVEPITALCCIILFIGHYLKNTALFSLPKVSSYRLMCEVIMVIGGEVKKPCTVYCLQYSILHYINTPTKKLNILVFEP